jgi:hypothetical protein
LKEAKEFLKQFTAEEIAAYRDVPVSDITASMGDDPKSQNEGMQHLAVKDAVYSALTVQNIANSMMAPEYDESELPSDMYWLGFAYRGLKEFYHRTHPRYKRMIHSTRTTDLLIEGRYKEDREDYIMAEQEAIQYWEDGGTDLHHVVAKRLAKKYNLKESGLKSKLALIAREYSRCFGMPGVKKTS